MYFNIKVNQTDCRQVSVGSQRDGHHHQRRCGRRQSHGERRQREPAAHPQNLPQHAAAAPAGTHNTQYQEYKNFQSTERKTTKYILVYTVSPPQSPPPTSSPAAAQSSTKKSRRPRRNRSLRRGTAEIQSAWLLDPQYQRDTVESTQASLDQDFTSMQSLVKVGEPREVKPV